MVRFFKLVVFIGIISSCVPRHKVIYIQNDKEFTYLEQDSIVITDDYVYRLQPGDVLSIKMSSITPEKYDLQQLEQNQSNESPLLSGYLIDNTGHVEVPFIGKIKVGKLTINEARLTIQESAQGKLINPQINVRLLTYTFTILGEVNKPGTYSSYKDKITLFEGLGFAGDLTDFADRAYVKLIREYGGKTYVKYLNMLDSKLLNSEYIFMRPGDIIYVPPLKAKNFSKYQLPNIAVGISMLTLISLLIVRIN